MKNGINHALNYKIEKSASGYIGKCIEIPSIIAIGKTKNDLDKKMHIAVEGYFAACSELPKTFGQSVRSVTMEIW